MRGIVCPEQQAAISGATANDPSPTGGTNQLNSGKNADVSDNVSAVSIVLQIFRAVNREFSDREEALSRQEYSIECNARGFGTSSRKCISHNLARSRAHTPDTHSSQSDTQSCAGECRSPDDPSARPDRTLIRFCRDDDHIHQLGDTDKLKTQISLEPRLLDPAHKCA